VSSRAPTTAMIARRAYAHGYCTLEDGTEVQYKTTDFYSPAHDRGIAWNDSVLMTMYSAASLLVDDLSNE